MKLIAKKPCSFNGRAFFIGEAIPEELVSNPVLQERLGVLSIVPDPENGTVSRTDNGVYTSEQVERMIAEAIEEAVNNTIMEMEQKQEELQKAVAEGVLPEGEFSMYDKAIPIAISKESDNGDTQSMAVPVMPEEVQQVFSIMQLNAEDGSKAIADVKSENVLILLHAIDSRKTIKDAARKQADKLFPVTNDANESANGNGFLNAGMEGVDT